MTRFEYKVIPAPKRGEKVRGARTTEDRFATALSGLMNRMGRDGWEYQRADTLPCEERSGFTGHSTTFQNMLIFRRVLTGVADGPDVGEATARLTAVTEVPELPQKPLAVEARLASIHPIPMPVRNDGPRLVTPAKSDAGKAPALGPASRNEVSGDTPAE